MATIKKRVLILSSSKQIKLSGHALCISNSLEIGEGFTKNLFSLLEAEKPGAGEAKVYNPFGLAKDEWDEIADYQIMLYMLFKDRLRQFGINSPQIFRPSN
jgi:hypothetical protein